MLRSSSRWRDGLVGAVISAIAFTVYWRTLAPSVAFLFDDTLEFQYVVPRLGIIHQTGYPLYTLLGKLFTLLVPLNDPAFRLNLFSAVVGAIAVGMVYLVLIHLVAHRWAAVVGALTFAAGQTFWGQAVIAEIYTAQMLLVALTLYLVLIWREEVQVGAVERARLRFYLLALVMGLGLTHHRLILLVYPAIALYIILVNRAASVKGISLPILARATVLFIAPLLLYLYLPLRGAVGSADGTYQNTLEGFFGWVMAQEYTVFLTQNPLQVQHDATYYISLFQTQFGMLGLLLSGMGIVWFVQRPREWLLLALALVAEAGFAFNYRVSDVYVHFLTTFLLLAIFLAAGADALLSVASRFEFRHWKVAVTAPLAGLLLLLLPLGLFEANYSVNDLSNKWDAYDYGVEILNQPLEKNATIIGIQGEVSLVRYLQENAGLRPDVETFAADKEEARLAAVERAIAKNQVVYLTRPLKGVAERYSLASFGPLVRVLPRPMLQAPSISSRVDKDFGGSLKLLGYDLDTTHLEPIPGRWHASNGRQINVTLYWQVLDKIPSDAMVSVKVLGKELHAVGQIDHRPVQSAYPTTNWRVGEIITDSYAVPVFLGTPPGAYTVNVTLYDSQSGDPIAATDLGRISVQGDFGSPRPEVWNATRTTDIDFGPLSLVGYSLDAEGPMRPGDALPLMLLWRAGATPMKDNLVLRLWLEDAEGRAASSRDAPLGNGFPVSLWRPNQFVRDWPLIRVPANVPSGTYSIKLATARGKELLGLSWGPLSTATVANLGVIRVQGRPRTMTAPPISHPREVAFDEKVRLLGYDLTLDTSAKAIRLTLYWKSLSLMDVSYAVFVHLLNTQGSVVSAADSIPGNGELPTAGWIENEIITDLHLVPIPEGLAQGTYSIEVGLYDPMTGERLGTADGKDRIILELLDVPPR